MLTCPEPTYEGLCKHLVSGQPSIGIFSAEGGQFIGGHGMTPEAMLRTAAGLSCLWDGEPIKRVRAGDGATMLPGRRVALHLMAQPDVAAVMLSDPLLLNQGLLSRCLVTAPESNAGSRFWREPEEAADAAIKRYGALSIRTAPTTRRRSPRVLAHASCRCRSTAWAICAIARSMPAATNGFSASIPMSAAPKRCATKFWRCLRARRRTTSIACRAATT